GSTRPMPMNEMTHANATAKTALGCRRIPALSLSTISLLYHVLIFRTYVSVVTLLPWDIWPRGWAGSSLCGPGPRAGRVVGPAVGARHRWLGHDRHRRGRNREVGPDRVGA